VPYIVHCNYSEPGSEISFFRCNFEQDFEESRTCSESLVSSVWPRGPGPRPQSSVSIYLRTYHVLSRPGHTGRRASLFHVASKARFTCERACTFATSRPHQIYNHKPESPMRGLPLEPPRRHAYIRPRLNAQDDIPLSSLSLSLSSPSSSSSSYIYIYPSYPIYPGSVYVSSDLSEAPPQRGPTSSLNLLASEKILCFTLHA
jgi:hypothetical protein